MLFCSKCGEKLNEDAQFCHKCGNKSISNNTEHEPTVHKEKLPKKKKKKSKALLIIIIILLILGALFALISLGIIRLDLSRIFDANEPATQATTAPVLAAEETKSIGTDDTQTKETNQSEDQPDESSSNSGGESLDADYPFQPIYDIEKRHNVKNYGSSAEFMEALTQNRWIFYETNKNPGATMFNGGYINIGYDDVYGDPFYEFYDNYISSNMFYEPGTVNLTGNLYQNYFDIGVLDDRYMAYIDTGDRVQYNGDTYMTVWVYYIDVYGDMVETIALINITNNELIYIANTNIYFGETIDYGSGGSNSSLGSALAPDCYDWSSQSEFEDAMLNSDWIFSHQISMPLDVDLGYNSYFPDYSDYDFYVEIEDNTLSYVGYEAGTGTEKYKGWSYFVTGQYCIYISNDQPYEYEGIVYDIGTHYYINSDGHLVERWVMYNLKDDIYIFVSNANIYYFIHAVDF